MSAYSSTKSMSKSRESETVVSSVANFDDLNHFFLTYPIIDPSDPLPIIDPLDPLPIIDPSDPLTMTGMPISTLYPQPNTIHTDTTNARYIPASKIIQDNNRNALIDELIANNRHLVNKFPFMSPHTSPMPSPRLLRNQSNNEPTNR
eukprot:UN03926